MMERMKMDGYGQDSCAKQPCAAEPPECYDAQQGISCTMMNSLDSMQDHARVLVERVATLTERLIGLENNTGPGESVPHGLMQTQNIRQGSLADIQARIDDLDSKLKEINYFLGRLETI